MNYRSTTPARSSRLYVGVALVAILCYVILFMYTNIVSAEPSTETKIELIDRQIEKLSDTSQTSSEASEATEKKLKELRSQRARLQSELAKTGQDLEILTKRIAQLSNQLESRRDVLGDVMVEQRLYGSITPLEMLMSSNSVADYFDRSAYQASLRDSLNRSVEEVKRLTTELEEKQAIVKRQQAAQLSQLGGLGDDIQNAEKRLVVIDGEGAHMTKLTAELARKKQRLQQEQQQFIQGQMGGAEQVSPGTIAQQPDPTPVVAPPKPVINPPKIETDPKPDTPQPTPTPAPSPAPPKPKPAPVILANGGYPSYLNNCYVDANALSYGIDPWGYGCRQCVSYTAWKVLQKSGKAAMYWGNAKQWPASAKARGYKTGTTPKKGSVGVMTTGYYGHVVWVESVNGNGTINISQYNYWLAGKPNGGWGYYSEFRNVSPSAYQTYIYI